MGAGFEGLGHALDGAALARRVPALEHEHERDARLVHLHFQLVQALLLLFQAILVLFVIEHQAMIDLIKAGNPVHDAEATRSRGVSGLRGSLLGGGLRHGKLLLGGTALQRHLLSRTGAIGLRLRGRRKGGGVLLRVKRLVERVDQRLGDLEVGATLVLAVDQVPRRVREVAALEQIVVQAVRLLVFADGGHLAIGHAPGGGGVAAQARQTLALRLLRHVDEELHHHVAVVGELLLEIGGAGKRAAQGVDVALLGGLAHGARNGGAGVEDLAVFDLHLAELGVEHALHGRGVPAAVVERDGAAAAERLPELLHHGIEAAHAVLGARERRRIDGVEVLGDVHAGGAGVKVVHKIGDAAALARAVPALEQHHKAHAGDARFLLQHHQTLGQRIAACLVLFLRKRFLREIDGLQHRRPSPSQSIPSHTASGPEQRNGACSMAGILPFMLAHAEAGTAATGNRNQPLTLPAMPARRESGRKGSHRRRDERRDTGCRGAGLSGSVTRLPKRCSYRSIGGT